MQDGQDGDVRKLSTLLEVSQTLGSTLDLRTVMPDLAFVNYVSDPVYYGHILRIPDLWRMSQPIDDDMSNEDAQPTRSGPTNLPRRTFIKSVIAGGVAVSSAAYLFRNSPLLGGGAACFALAVSFAPVQPSGCPSAMAPPCWFTRRSSRERARMTASDCDAKASFNSMTSRSSSERLARCTALRMASTGPMPMIIGSTPVVQYERTRASGLRPSSAAR